MGGIGDVSSVLGRKCGEVDGIGGEVDKIGGKVGGIGGEAE